MPALRKQLMMLAGYHQWATQMLLGEHVSGLSDEQYHRDCGLFFKSVYGTLNHLIVGESLVWFRRFGGKVSAPIPAGLKLNSIVEEDRQQVQKRLLEQAARWQPVIAGVSDDHLAGTLSYTSMEGEANTLPFAATLAHVFNHATHHRGQITAAITMMGLESPEIDMVWYLQQEARK